jgi:hypothetical protein
MENKYENFCGEGGGIHGLAYAGCIQALEELQIRKGLKRFTGSSIGALYASFLAMNVSAEKVIDVSLKLDLKKIRSQECFLKRMYNLWKRYGQYNNTYLLNTVKWAYVTVGVNPNVTFQENYEKTGNELYIPGTNVNRHKVYFFSHYTHPRMSILQAVTISMCLPMVYMPFYINGDIYVDGGFSENYPIYIFNDLEKLRQGNVYEIDREPICEKTLGIKLLASDELNALDSYHGRVATNGVVSVVTELVNTMALQAESADISPSYISQTIPVKKWGNSLFELDKPIKEIIEVGRQSVYEYFGKKKENENKTENKEEIKE